jgi:hypothetical protein
MRASAEYTEEFANFVRESFAKEVWGVRVVLQTCGNKSLKFWFMLSCFLGFQKRFETFHPPIVLDLGGCHGLEANTHIYIYICEKDVYFVDLNLRHMCNLMFSTARNTWQN